MDKLYYFCQDEYSRVLDTVDSKKDGIQYLHDNIQKGIITKLTGKYELMILQEIGTKNVPIARKSIIRPGY